MGESVCVVTFSRKEKKPKNCVDEHFPNSHFFFCTEEGKKVAIEIFSAPSPMNCSIWNEISLHAPFNRELQVRTLNFEFSFLNHPIPHMAKIIAGKFHPPLKESGVVRAECLSGGLSGLCKLAPSTLLSQKERK